MNSVYISVTIWNQLIITTFSICRSATNKETITQNYWTSVLHHIAHCRIFAGSEKLVICYWEQCWLCQFYIESRSKSACLCIFCKLSGQCLGWLLKPFQKYRHTCPAWTSVNELLVNLSSATNQTRDSMKGYWLRKNSNVRLLLWDCTYCTNLFT